jgi:hypothetical protein
VIIDYVASTIGGTVQHVDEDGGRLGVLTEEGTALTFTLNQATN